MKKVFLFAAAAALLAACSSNDLSETAKAPQTAAAEGSVGFDVYTQKANTRAGWAGSLTTDKLKENNATLYSSANGFGVFGYYTDNNEYEQRSLPNFMYNQNVKWNSGTTAWEYSPVTYWPNEYGSNAVSDDQDKLTFFAYAPWVDIIPSNGKVRNTATAPADNTKELESYGITGMTKNTTPGDPILKYIGSFDNGKSVDLCWGVADNNDGRTWDLTQTGTVQTNGPENGLPWIDMERPAGVDQKVRFTFKHATAQMRVSIDAVVDDPAHGLGEEVAAKTRIWVREVKFKGFTMKGSLNLNNTDANKPLWLDYNGQNELVAEDVVVFDGRKEGKEGVAGAVATNEKVLGLNPTLIQDGTYAPSTGTDVYESDALKVQGVNAAGAPTTGDAWLRKGVTNTPVNLFCTTEDNKSDDANFNTIINNAFFHVIPVNDNFEVEIVYDVETVDPNLAQNLSDGATKGSSIENRITKTIKFGEETLLQAGHSYTLALHLGMNSVKFDAAVTDWIYEAAQDVDLPLNTPVWAANTTGSSAGSSADPYAVTIPYTGNYSFAISGLNGGESITATVGKNTKSTDGAAEAESGSAEKLEAGWDVTADNAWSNGYAVQTVTTVPNPNTVDRKQKWSWKGNQSNIDTYFEFEQAAHPLFAKITGNTATTVTLTRYNDAYQTASGHWTQKYGWLCSETGEELTTSGDPENATPANGINVYRNGAKLTHTTADPNAGEFKFVNQGEDDNMTAKITFADPLHGGDVIKVVIKTGDAPVETVTYRVP